MPAIRAVVYEVQLTHLPNDGRQWRRQALVFALARDVEGAIRLAKAAYPDDPEIIQVIKRCRESSVMVEADLLVGERRGG